MVTRVRVLAGVREEMGRTLRVYMNGQPDLHLIDCIENGVCLVKQVPVEQPDAVVVDLVLPGLDGLGILEQLQTIAVPYRPKVLVVAPAGPDALLSWLLEAGADYVLVKPASMEVLGNRIRQLVSPGAGRSLPWEPWGGPARHADPSDTGSLEAVVDRVLREIGLPSHINGFFYLRLGIMLVSRDLPLISAVTKELYPAIARHYQTTPSRVERSIRHAIEVVWTRGDPRRLKELFYHSAGRPTNAEFIALLSTHLGR